MSPSDHPNSSRSLVRGPIGEILRYWPRTAAGILIVSVLSVVGGLWLFAHVKGDGLGAIGVVLAVLGLCLSLGGFAVTLWQLERTQIATNAVEGALTRVRQDYQSFDLISEVKSTQASVSVAKAHLHAGRLPDVALSYETIRSGLSRMVSAPNGLSSTESEQAKDQIARALDTCTSIYERDARPEAVNLGSIRASLWSIDDLLIKVELRLKGLINAA